MDIAQLSMDMAQSRVMNEVSVAMLDKTMEMVQEQTDMMTDMVANAGPTIHDVNPAIGGNIDLAI